MALALAEARLAAEAGEVPVGAVLFLGDQQLASGQNRVLRDHDPTAHAEVVALRIAGQQLRNYRLLNCTLYCTLEPCAMCAGAMIHARLGRLVYGAADPKTGAAGSMLQVLNHPELNHQLPVTPGILADACGGVLQQFFRARRRSLKGSLTSTAAEAEG
ncbi:tRNA adenosine(34) deaminase TadA [Acidipila sp. EB88]|uniref:tRNA adenosine(34) deaminase TadA n=1 Tax=Acidipila sp. EB88 TaxID=2305226 RepID=UPI000F5FDE8F|nr:tRNA adenosine(34) deaminase TadA [Acidipila sp. EB88]RRA50286.1 tRNA adenosine(34) deaminase TadA [Acidipila sp. EB88]